MGIKIPACGEIKRKIINNLKCTNNEKTIILLSLALVSWGAFAQHDHSKMTNKSMVQSSFKVEQSKSASAIIDNYLALKDALVQDDSKKAASIGKKLFDVFSKFDISTQAKQKQMELAEIIEDASEHVKHISENSKKIAHQREHFEVLSKDIKDMVIITGSDRTLYQTFFPMYNNNKGGAWLSNSKEIKKPYFGSKMLKCGSVQQKIKLK